MHSLYNRIHTPDGSLDSMGLTRFFYISCPDANLTIVLEKIDSSFDRFLSLIGEFVERLTLRAIRTDHCVILRLLLQM